MVQMGLKFQVFRCILAEDSVCCLGTENLRSSECNLLGTGSFVTVKLRVFRP